MNERLIQEVVMRFALEAKHAFAVPNNTTIFPWESDVISCTRSDMLHEYEIKLTVNDWHKEFREKKFKHRQLAWAKTYARNCPNYFWFVTHGFDLPKKHKLPDWAGWMRVELHPVTDLLHPITMKQAPRLHGQKNMRARERALRSLSYRLLKYLEKYNEENNVVTTEKTEAGHKVQRA